MPLGRGLRASALFFEMVGSKMRIYTLSNIDMVHISEFTRVTGRSNQSTRRLIEQGNVIRKMKFYRDRSRLMIPVAELHGYPFVQAGHSSAERMIFHYVRVDEDKYEKQLCKACTFGEMCEERKAAEVLDVPEGDR